MPGIYRAHQVRFFNKPERTAGPVLRKQVQQASFRPPARTGNQGDIMAMFGKAENASQGIFLGTAGNQAGYDMTDFQLERYYSERLTGERSVTNEKPFVNLLSGIGYRCLVYR